jgi:hypothetical protein
MGTMTAQMLIGAGHPNHDGIDPNRYLFLSENSRPAWLLVEENIFQTTNREKRVVWVPTVESMLEDAFLMIALHVVKDQGLVQLARSYSRVATSHRLELYDSFDDTQRRELYEKCRGLTTFPKMILSVFTGSTLMRQLGVIEKYDMDIEVCTPAYVRLSSAWSRERIVEGSVKPIRHSE